jgi:hypothetical protein
MQKHNPNPNPSHTVEAQNAADDGIMMVDASKQSDTSKQSLTRVNQIDYK